MPYRTGKNLPGERASKLGHLEVLKSPLVEQLVRNFRQPDAVDTLDGVCWQPFPPSAPPLDLIFAVDGSWQSVEDDRPPYKALAFVKTALMKIDQVALKRIDRETPHPLALRDLMKEAALYHATAFPLRHIHMPGLSLYHAVRYIIFESIKDAALNGEIMETLKWLAYHKWRDTPRTLPKFECPHCESDQATLPIDAESGKCPICHNTIFITDFFGFHLDMIENAASESVASAYTNIHETLLLFTGIRYFWQTDRRILSRCLFMKDGPLQLRAQYSKLVNPIRDFLNHTCQQGYPVTIVGQEKSGLFVDHLDLIGRESKSRQFFVPDHRYICERIQCRPPAGAPYGKDTNYGAKVFVVLDERCKLVLNIPVSVAMQKFIMAPQASRLINLNRILATLPMLLSSKYENALLPIELVNSIASLSTYPSAQILKLFTDATVGKTT
jgi:hypothetical protein